MTEQQWIVVAAVVQAVSAIAIVVLTVRLARTAAGALTAAKDQGDSAAGSLKEMRRQGRLAAVPLLDVSPAFASMIDGAVHHTTIDIANVSDRPALGIVAAMATLATDRREGSEVAWSDRLAMLGPGAYYSLSVSADDLRNVPNLTGRAGPSDLYASDWLLIRLRYQSMLGAQVMQEYEWYANAPEQGTPGVWALRKVQVRADPDDPADVEELKPGQT